MCKYGFTPAISRDITVVLKGKDYNTPPTPLLVDDIPLPSTPLSKYIADYARAALPEETFNHAMRVYYFGQSIQTQQFPEWDYDPEVYYIICLLHDLGTTPENRRKTKMSFEFQGASIAHELLMQRSGDRELAESVAEAIIRHQDLGTTGKITAVGGLVQVATVFDGTWGRTETIDNLGGHASLVHRGTINDVVARFPRKNWSSCFAATVREEIKVKPWCHTTALGENDFAEAVKGNKLMEPYELEGKDRV
ncbi:hypothetical protein RUND412_000110 [Rhizina undulata]